MEEKRVKTSQDNHKEEEQGEGSCLSRHDESLLHQFDVVSGADRRTSAAKYQGQTDPCINGNRFIIEMLFPFGWGRNGLYNI